MFCLKELGILIYTENIFKECVKTTYKCGGQQENIKATEWLCIDVKSALAEVSDLQCQTQTGELCFQGQW